MRIRSFALALIVLAAACGKKTPAAAPAPDAGGSTIPGSTSGTTGTTGTTGARTNSDAGAAAVTADLVRAMQEPIYFDYDQDGVRADGQPTLDRKAVNMLVNPGVRIRIAGHTDDRGSDEYNLVLGNKRATAAKRYLEAKGIDGGRIETISYGEEKPVDPAQTEAAWAKNRRDEFDLLSGADKLVKPQ